MYIERQMTVLMEHSLEIWIYKKVLCALHVSFFLKSIYYNPTRIKTCLFFLPFFFFPWSAIPSSAGGSVSAVTAAALPPPQALAVSALLLRRKWIREAGFGAEGRDGK